DADSLSVGSVTDTAMSMSVSTTGITSGGFDVKLATTSGALSLEAPVTLGAGDLTLNINGDVSQTSTGGITAAGLQILGTGTVRLDSATNNVTTLAANHSGSISYLDADSLTVGSVTDTAMSMSVSTTGLTSGGFDVKLATTSGALSIEAPVTLGAGDLTLNINGAVSQTSSGGITAAGLQILGTGTVRLDSATNNVTTLAANHSGSISYLDADSLTVGSVSTTGITSGGFDVKLATTNGALSIEAPVTLGAGDLTLSINGDVSQTSAGGITAAGLQIL